MRVRVKRMNGKFHTVGTNSTGQSINMDAPVQFGGEQKGASPIELLLMAIGGCSSIDVTSGLNELGEQIDELDVVIDGDRYTDRVPSTFSDIRIHYKIKGAANESSVRKVIDESMETYCTVAKMLEKTATINYKITINNKVLA